MSNSTLMLSDITIKEWRSISHAKIDFSINGEPRKKTIFLGENGAGKTSILRAIALSTVPVIEATALIAEMSGIQRRKNKKGVTSPESCIIAKFVDRSGKEEFSVTTKIVLGSDGKEMVIRETIPIDFPWDRVFSAGYGVGRGVRGAAEISEYDRRTSVLSLFKDNAPLFDAESVLKAIALESKFNETTKRPQFPSLNYFKKIIRNLFCLSPAHRIDVAGKGVYVHGPWGSQPFHALGDGYRSAAGWVLDFLARAWSLDGNTRKEPSGIVLVDEVDEHLHPSWARKIISILIRNFPEVQFIFTTHSPVPIVNSMPNELVVIPIARVYGDIACLVVMGLQPLAHTIALFSRVALFQKGETVARCPACHVFQGSFGFAYTIKVLRQGHVRLVEIQMLLGMVANFVACFAPVGNQV